MSRVGISEKTKSNLKRPAFLSTQITTEGFIVMEEVKEPFGAETKGDKGRQVLIRTCSCMLRMCATAIRELNLIGQIVWFSTKRKCAWHDHSYTDALAQ